MIIITLNVERKYFSFFFIIGWSWFFFLLSFITIFDMWICSESVTELAFKDISGLWNLSHGRKYFCFMLLCLIAWGYSTLKFLIIKKSTTTERNWNIMYPKINNNNFSFKISTIYENQWLTILKKPVVKKTKFQEWFTFWKFIWRCYHFYSSLTAL